MKRLLVVFLCWGLSTQLAMAERVDSLYAENVAKNFYLQQNPNRAKSPLRLELIQTYSSTVQNTNGDSPSQIPLIYIYKAYNADGFVLISGDDRVIPILGYSNTGTFSNSNIPPALQKLIEDYKKQILYAQEKEIVAIPEIEEQWHNLTENLPYTKKSEAAVNPLLSTTWNQSPYYNDLCPYNIFYLSHTLTGCTATAMAQIMKFWNYPNQGTGFHSYVCPFYGKQTANFASTTYNWAAMPNNVSSTNNAVATLMYHCGVSVNMDYGVSSSGAWVIYDNGTHPDCAENAYKTYFGYDPSTIQGLKREYYTDNEWKDLLKADLDNGRPIQYVGSGTGGGHTFVCDGYDAYEYFHMNWGWGGQSDGYFILDALNPGELGSGGGTGGYNSNQQAVIGIQPLSGGNLSSNIELYSAITITPEPINFYSAFTVIADFYNAGSSNFTGDYCAAIFDSEGTFIDYIQILTAEGNPLPSGYHYTGGLTFSNDGLQAVPGNYSIGVYYRETGGEWVLAASTSYTNPVYATINAPYNPLEQYSEIVTTPSVFVQGQAASVNVNLYNTNSYTYYGMFSAALYDVEGNFIQTIGTYNETSGLAPDYIYSAPYLTFTCESITASPGTYMLAILEKESGSSSPYFVGGSYYKTPVNIIVIEAPLSPDGFEPNDNQANARNLSLNWSNNLTDIYSTGSNNHIGTDYDFYKINLTSGYNYVITARIHDSYNSGNGQIYTNDVVWSFNKGAGWSEAIDDIMTGNISVNGAGVVYFQVSPFFSGQTGTYLLDIKVQRTTNVGIKELSSNTIELYPNPVKDELTIDIGEMSGIKNFEILNSTGQVVYQSSIINKVAIHMAHFSSGVYLIRFETDNSFLLRKFTKE